MQRWQHFPELRICGERSSERRDSRYLLLQSVYAWRRHPVVGARAVAMDCPVGGLRRNRRSPGSQAVRLVRLAVKFSDQLAPLGIRSQSLPLRIALGLLHRIALLQRGAQAGQGLSLTPCHGVNHGFLVHELIVVGIDAARAADKVEALLGIAVLRPVIPQVAERARVLRIYSQRLES